ncbi:MAG: fumarate hydratase [Candidatus Omnitrophota bacterium]
MRKIKTQQITEKIRELALKANFFLRKDVLNALESSLISENNISAKHILQVLIENAKIANKEKLAICQDTGMAVVFCEIGEDVQIVGDINRAINDGAKAAYKEGYLRKSVVMDPFVRVNTNTNTPCVIHYDFVKGCKIKLTVLPKGFGSENSGKIRMFNPTQSEDDIVDFIVSCVKEAGASACPPFILGIGIGGTMDKAAFLAKKSLLDKIDKENKKAHLANLERKILLAVNRTNIGPSGLKGDTTCLGVKILSFPTHIAGLPVALNISCHALRSASGTI